MQRNLILHTSLQIRALHQNRDLVSCQCPEICEQGFSSVILLDFFHRNAHFITRAFDVESLGDVDVRVSQHSLNDAVIDAQNG